MAGRPKKYLTDEERKQSLRDNAKRYHEKKKSDPEYLRKKQEWTYISRLRMQVAN